MSRSSGETVARSRKSTPESAPSRECSQDVTRIAPARNGTTERSRSAISDSPTVEETTHDSSAISSWLRSGPVRISRGPGRTYFSIIRISSVQKLWPRYASRDQTRAAPSAAYASHTAVRDRSLVIGSGGGDHSDVDPMAACVRSSRGRRPPHRPPTASGEAAAEQRSEHAYAVERGELLPGGAIARSIVDRHLVDPLASEQDTRGDLGLDGEAALAERERAEEV